MSKDKYSLKNLTKDELIVIIARQEQEINFLKEKEDNILYFEKQLAEREKEIAKLKNFMSKWHFENFEIFENHYNYLMTLKNREQLANENEALKDTIAVVLAQKKNVEKNIRKQVCDAIKEKLKKQIIPNAGSWLSYYDITETNDLLDQIEGAEQV